MKIKFNGEDHWIGKSPSRTIEEILTEKADNDFYANNELSRALLRGRVNASVLDRLICVLYKKCALTEEEVFDIIKADKDYDTVLSIED